MQPFEKAKLQDPEAVDGMLVNVETDEKFPELFVVVGRYIYEAKATPPGATNVKCGLSHFQDVISPCE